MTLFRHAARAAVASSVPMHAGILLLVLLLGAPAAAQDVLTVGTVNAAPGQVSVPVYLRDVAATPLGIDRPAADRIQGFAFKVTFDPPSAIGSASFVREGVLGGLTPLYETSVQPQGGGALAYVVSFAQSNNPVPMGSNAPPPGNVIGRLVLNVAAAGGSTVALRIDSATATLSNQTGTTIETAGNGKLALVAGGINVLTPVVRGDLTGDAKADLVWRNDGAGQSMLWALNGAAVTATTNLPASGSDWRIRGIDDFNGDGRSDLLWTNLQTGAAAIWLMNGAAVSDSAVIGVPGTSWQVQGVGDFNNDARADILWRNVDTNAAVVWMMNAFTITSSATVAYPSPQWSVQGVGDFNGDRRVDLLWRNSETNEAWAWLMDGAAIANTGYVASPNSDWSVKGVADFSGDGRADVLWRNSTTNQVVVWTMNSTAVTGAGYLATPPPAWDVRAAADFNGDARADLMWRHGTTGENVVWLLDGTTISSTGYLPTLADQNWTVAGPR